MSILALGMPDLAFFHLLAHALFKALLFLCAGVIIHNVKDCQDIRHMGRLVKIMPLTRACITLSNLALCGMPFIAGFYSKDIILEVAFIRDINKIAFLLYALATGLTVCYTMRLVFYRLSGDYGIGSLSCISEKNRSVITRPMIVLSLGAVTGGRFLSWALFPERYIICLSPWLKWLALGVRLVGGLIGYLLNIMNVNYTLKSLILIPRVYFIGSMWFMPYLSRFVTPAGSLKVGARLEKNIDKGWMECLGAQGVYKVAEEGSLYVELSQNKGLKFCLKTVVAWAVILSFMAFYSYNLYLEYCIEAAKEATMPVSNNLEELKSSVLQRKCNVLYYTIKRDINGIQPLWK